MLALFDAMMAEAEAWLTREAGGAAAARASGARSRRAISGRNFEVKVDADGLGPDDVAALIERFHAAHAREYGYAIRERAGRAGDLPAAGDRRGAQGAAGEGSRAGASLEAAELGRRKFYVDAARGWREGAGLPARGAAGGGADRRPAVINEMSATTVLLPGSRRRVDEWGNLIWRSR
jgi:N-methylhydantoinase A